MKFGPLKVIVCPFSGYQCIHLTLVTSEYIHTCMYHKTPNILATATCAVKYTILQMEIVARTIPLWGLNVNVILVLN